VASNGDIYIADSGSQRLRKVTASTGIIDTIAGSDVFESTGDGGPAIDATFYYPQRVALDPAGNLFVIDDNPDGSRVRRIDASSGIITTIAGGGSEDIALGIATQVELPDSFDLAADAAGNVFITSD